MGSLKPLVKARVSKADNKDIMHILIAPNPIITSPKKGSKLEAMSIVILMMKRLIN